MKTENIPSNDSSDMRTVPQRGGRFTAQRRLKTTLSILTGFLFATLAMAASVMAASIDDAGPGRDAFDKRCGVCHALDKVKLGPPLRGVYGRKAGKNRQFSYSDSMKNTSVTWDETTLDRWLTETASVIWGSDMDFRLNDPAERANIIAYLRLLSAK
jgi:cytochrome c